MTMNYDDFALAKLAKTDHQSKGIGVELTQNFLNETKLVHRLEVKTEITEEIVRHLRIRGLVGINAE
jgi:hypothetical protein